MLNKFALKNSKTTVNILVNQALKNFAAAAKAAPNANEGMAARFHDIYVKELEKLQKTQ